MIDGLKAAWTLVGHKLKNHGNYVFCMMVHDNNYYVTPIRTTPSRGKVLHSYD